jgi:hypothetical protein
LAGRVHPESDVGASVVPDHATAFRFPFGSRQGTRIAVADYSVPAIRNFGRSEPIFATSGRSPALAQRDRHDGQSPCPRGRRRVRGDRGDRRNAAPLPASIHRAVFRQTQGSFAQGRRALNPRPLGPNRKQSSAPLPQKSQLLQTRRAWVKLKGIRFSFSGVIRFREGTRGHNQTRPCPASSIIQEASENP